jgi:integrase
MDYPKTFKSGSVSAKVYKVKEPNGKTGWAYVASWTAADGRRTKKFADATKACAEARKQAAGLAAGSRATLEGMTSSDVQELRQARQKAAPMPLLAALDEWRSWKDAKERLPKKTVAEAMAAFTKHKRELGIKVKASYERTLPDFVKEFGKVQLSEMTAQQMHDWLTKRHPVPASRNSHLSRIVTAFAWCRDQEWLRQGRTEAQKVATVKVPTRKIGILTADQIERCLEALDDAEAKHYYPAFALAMFCGLRRTEVHGQLWEDINVERGFLKVSAVKPNTPAYRLVKLRPAALALMAAREEKGPVCQNLAVDRIRDICLTPSLPLPKNCFRHTWISALVAETGDVQAVAHEAGNSPKKIFQHYRELMTPEEAKAIFSVRP